MYTTREQWLLAAIDEFRPMFKQAQLTVPKQLKVSCGFPGCGDRKKRIGECWTDAKQVFISPMLADENQVLSTLTHELCHACLPAKVKHGAEFKAAAKNVGLVGKARECNAGPELLEKFKPIVKKLGPYPHTALNLGQRPEKKQGTRLLKVECGCGLIIRMTQKWLDEGQPKCWLCGKKMEAA